MNIVLTEAPLWASYLGLGVFLAGYAALSLFVAWRLRHIVDEYEKEEKNALDK